MRVTTLARLLLGSLLTFALFAGGCSPDQSEGGKAAGTKAGAERKLVIAVIPKGTVHEFWKSVQKGALQAGEELGVEIRWDGPTNETEHDRQRSIVENMISLGVEGIVLAPTDERALVRPVQLAVKAGMPVVIFDSELAWDGYVSFVATNNEKGGRIGGEYLVKLLGTKGGKVVLLRYTEGSGSTLRREKGFKAAIDAAENVELVAEQFTDGSTAGALNTAVNMLTRFVEDNELQIDGIFASNLPTSLGMQKALDRFRKEGVKVHAHFVGFDSSEELVRGLQAGEIDALVVQRPVKIGYMGVKTLVDHLRGKQVPRYIDTGVELVTRERLKEPAIRRLVGLEE